ncbi:MAG: 50S ribosomal protein L3 [Nanoarchaeota archaeon]|nr:50S ribosomal protein L3 [Nanoarchaeota archaeon]MBU1028317.1 50S ribosomal protein L3 [Nanoarchaeota archaeon]
MPTRKSPRKGSLQFWPRKRASRVLPRVNWNSIPGKKSLKGFICYKAGMRSAIVKNNTPNSMTKDKKIAIPCTIFECPPMKIFSVRFYKNGKVTQDILAENLDKELKKKVKLPKKSRKKIEDIKDYDDIHLIFYSVIKKTGLKKKPNLLEIGLVGNLDEKLNFIKENFNKEISINQVFEKGQLVDFRGLTKGKGFQGPVKRFGVTLRNHKSEKGRRGPGSIGPWHPARVTFRVPMAGQLGMFTRIIYNNKIIDIGESSNKPIKNLKNFGDLKTDYLIVNGSIQGPAKRALIATSPLRESKKQSKKNYELVELR